MAWCLPEAEGTVGTTAKGFARSRQQDRSKRKFEKNIGSVGTPCPRGNCLPFLEIHSEVVVHDDCGTVLIHHSMSNPPSAKAILQLYASMLRTSRSFSSYNFREYFLRRTKTTFREIQVCNHPFSDVLTRLTSHPSSKERDGSSAGGGSPQRVDEGARS